MKANFVSTDKKSISFLKMNPKNIGFSLMEMLATIAIIGLLTAIAIPSYQKYKNASLVQKILSNVLIVQESVMSTQAYKGYINLTTLDTINKAKDKLFKEKNFFTFHIFIDSYYTLSNTSDPSKWCVIVSPNSIKKEYQKLGFQGTNRVTLRVCIDSAGGSSHNGKSGVSGGNCNFTFHTCH